jgi:hypothetical protein
MSLSDSSTLPKHFKKPIKFVVYGLVQLLYRNVIVAKCVLITPALQCVTNPRKAMTKTISVV